MRYVLVDSLILILITCSSITRNTFWILNFFGSVCLRSQYWKSIVWNCFFVIANSSPGITRTPIHFPNILLIFFWTNLSWLLNRNLIFISSGMKSTCLFIQAHFNKSKSISFICRESYVIIESVLLGPELIIRTRT